MSITQMGNGLEKKILSRYPKDTEQGNEGKKPPKFNETYSSWKKAKLREEEPN